MLLSLAMYLLLVSLKPLGTFFFLVGIINLAHTRKVIKIPSGIVHQS